MRRSGWLELILVVAAVGLAAYWMSAGVKPGETPASPLAAVTATPTEQLDVPTVTATPVVMATPVVTATPAVPATPVYKPEVRFSPPSRPPGKYEEGGDSLYVH